LSYAAFGPGTIWSDIILIMMFVTFTIISISGTEGYVATQDDRDGVLLHNIRHANLQQLIKLAKLNSEPFERAASIIRTYWSTGVSIYSPSAVPGEESIRAAFIVLREIKRRHTAILEKERERRHRALREDRESPDLEPITSASQVMPFPVGITGPSTSNLSSSSTRMPARSLLIAPQEPPYNRAPPKHVHWALLPKHPYKNQVIFTLFGSRYQIHVIIFLNKKLITYKIIVGRYYSYEFQ